MNCKPGDLAVIVRARVSANLGRIIRVTSFDPYSRFVDRPGVSGGWRYEGAELISSEFGLRCLRVPDDVLRPIRDTDGDDESFSWAGKPQGVTA